MRESLNKEELLEKIRTAKTMEEVTMYQAALEKVLNGEVKTPKIRSMLETETGDNILEIMSRKK